ncbi:MAG: hypothetical protein ABSF43_04270 [Rectinemataceae bacterium]|jgi:hypothetical protein
MSLGEALAVSLKVIADWRVILITVAVLLIWAALRYVGSVYRKRSSPRRRTVPPAYSRPSSPTVRPASRAGAETASAKDMIE